MVTAIIVAAALLAGCSEPPEERAAAGGVSFAGDCEDCHEARLDDNHQLACLYCHYEDPGAAGYPDGHPALVARPAHPDHADRACGDCHEALVAMVTDNAHYRLFSHIDQVRRAFGATNEVASASLLPVVDPPATVADLADDLLRRRCLRCHVYGSGDDYDAVRRAAGCGACHLGFDDGRLSAHHFAASPPDRACLSCHYGNHVGFDFYGRFEHDYNEEYRTPYLADREPRREFGVEYHQLEADVHHRAGMVCVDCHGLERVMGDGSGPSCRDCHDAGRPAAAPPATVELENGGYVFTSSATGLSLPVPLLEHPAHERYRGRAACQACHARWTPNDRPTHLLRVDHDDFDAFEKLTVDGSSETHRILHNYFDPGGDLLDPVMTDKFTGVPKAGVWLKGYGERRWEDVVLIVDDGGLITPARPMLDLRLSWIDADETVHFDDTAPPPGTRLLLPYVPHTTGPAGIFYEERLRPLLDAEPPRP